MCNRYHKPPREFVFKYTDLCSTYQMLISEQPVESFPVGGRLKRVRLYLKSEKVFQSCFKKGNLYVPSCFHWCAIRMKKNWDEKRILVRIHLAIIILSMVRKWSFVKDHFKNTYISNIGVHLNCPKNKGTSCAWYIRKQLSNGSGINIL